MAGEEALVAEKKPLLSAVQEDSAGKRKNQLPETMCVNAFYVVCMPLGFVLSTLAFIMYVTSMYYVYYADHTGVEDSLDSFSNHFLAMSIFYLLDLLIFVFQFAVAVYALPWVCVFKQWSYRMSAVLAVAGWLMHAAFYILFAIMGQFNLNAAFAIVWLSLASYAVSFVFFTLTQCVFTMNQIRGREI